MLLRMPGLPEDLFRRMRRANLTFGDRVHCPFLRPFFLSPEDEEHLRAHLNGCPPCVEFVRTYRATSGLCRKALVKSMPPEVAGRLRSFIRGKLESK